jgi:peptidoglycan/xylan/chitin deacetylase (PgdA/CDA1 family)
MCLFFTSAGLAFNAPATADAIATVMPSQSATMSVEQIVDGIVENTRKVILLHEFGGRKLSRERTEAGHYLFFQNRVLASQLVERALASDPDCRKLVDFWRAGTGWLEVDRLATFGVFAELESKLGSISACLPEVRRLRTTINRIRAAYNVEVTAILDDRAETRPGDRPKWTEYTKFLAANYAVPTVLAELDLIPAAPTTYTRPTGTAKALTRRAANDEWTDGGLPEKTVLLTFDDGPHPIYTPRILDVLAKYKIRAVFFMIGQNLGSVDKDGIARLKEPELVARILREGHFIANHTHTHPLLPKLDAIAVTDEIDLTEVLLTRATADGVGRAKLFRPPYGARNDLVLAEIAARGLRSVIWNVDSRDWADPIPKSVAKRVVDEITRERRGIVLFHDIHPRTVDAVPLVIEALLKRGFQFAHFDGADLVVGAAPELDPKASQEPSR